MEQKRTPTEALEAVIAHLGGKASRLAEEIGMSAQMVSFMRRGERAIPADKAPLMERLTGGAVRCEELCPGVAWDVLRMQVSVETEQKVG